MAFEFKYMSSKRYRIGIIKEKMSNWHGWYSDYELESDASIKLAKAIEKDLDKFRVYEVKPNADISSEKRREILQAAFLHLSKKYSN